MLDADVLRWRIAAAADPANDPVPSHRAVRDAVVARDPAAAEYAMRALVEKSVVDLRHAEG